MPFISAIPDRTNAVNTSTANIPFTIGDQETPASALVVTASHDNAALVQDIILGGVSVNRTVSVVPRPDAVGTALITITVADGDNGASAETFLLTVAGPPPQCVFTYCPTNMVVDCQNPNGAVVNFSAMGTNICNSSDLTFDCDLVTGGTFPIGTSPVNCWAIGSGQTNHCTFTVSVLSNCPPSSTYQGFVHSPLSGTTLATNGLGQLVIGPLLGPAAGGLRLEFGAIEGVTAAFAETVTPSEQNSNVLLGVTVFGTNGSSLAQIVMSNYLGSLDVWPFLLGTNQPARYGLRIWQGTVLALDQSGRLPPTPNSVANHLFLVKTPKKVKARLNENGALVVEFAYDPNAPDNFSLFTGGNAFSSYGDRFEFISEAVLNSIPSVPLDFLSALEFQFRQPEFRTLTDVVATKFGHELRGVGAGLLTGEPGILRLDLQTVGGNGGVKFELAGKSAAEVTFEFPPSQNLTQLVASVEGDSGSLSDFTLTPVGNDFWDNHFEAVVDFTPVAAADLWVEALSNGVVIASANTSTGAPVRLAVSFPSPGSSALTLGAQINMNGSLTRTLTLPGPGFTVSLPGVFADLGPVNQVRFTTVGGVALPPGLLKVLSVQGQAAVVGYVTKLTGLTSSDLNPFKPQSFVGHVVSAVGHATFARNAIGDLTVGNLGTVGTSNGVRLEFADLPSGFRDHVEVEFDRTIAGATTPAGASFRYELHGANGLIDFIDGRSSNPGGAYIATVRRDPANFAFRTLKLSLQGSLFHQELRNVNTYGWLFAPWVQPKKVSARFLTDGSLLWTLTWSNSVPVEGLVATYNPRSCDQVEILSSANLFPPGTSIRALEIKGSGVASRTLLAPPPPLNASLRRAGGRLGLQLSPVLTPRDQFLQKRVLPISFSGEGWVPLCLPMTILESDPTTDMFVPVDPDVTGVLLRTLSETPVVPGECPTPSTTVANYFLNSSTGWTLRNFWDLLGSLWATPGPPEQVTVALMAEVARLTGIGLPPDSFQQQRTRELLEGVTASNPASLGAPAGPGAPIYTTLYVNSAQPVSPSNNGTTAFPFNSIENALNAALRRGLPAVELQLRGTFSGAAQITRHTRIIPDIRDTTPDVTVGVAFTHQGTCIGCETATPLIEAAAPFRFELKNVDVGSAPPFSRLSVQAKGSAYTVLENVTLTSVTHEGSAAAGEGAGTLIMKKCRVRNPGGPGVHLTGGVNAFVSDSVVTNCQGVGFLVCADSMIPTPDVAVAMLRTRITHNGTRQDDGTCAGTAGAVVVKGRVALRMDWCRVDGNRGPAVAAIGANARVCLRFTSIADVLPFTPAAATRTFAIGLGAYQGATVQASFCDLGGSTTATSDYAVQLASGGTAVFGATRFHGFPIVANVQSPGFDPATFFQCSNCLDGDMPLPPINTDPVPTPVP